MKNITMLIITILTILCIPVNSTATPVTLSVSGEITATFGTAVPLFTVGAEISLFDVTFDDDSLGYTVYNTDNTIRKEVSIDPSYTSNSSHPVEYFPPGSSGYTMFSDATFNFGTHLQALIDGNPNPIPSPNGNFDYVGYQGNVVTGTYTFTSIFSKGFGYSLSAGLWGPDSTGTSALGGSLILVDGQGNTNKVIWRTYIDQVIIQGAPVPEPATMLLFGLGILSFAGVNRKKGNRNIEEAG